EFERAIAPSVATVNRLEPDLLKRQQQVEDARRSVDSKQQQYESKIREKSKDLTNYHRILEQAKKELKLHEDTLRPIQKEYDTAKNNYNSIVNEFNRKYSPAIKQQQTLEKEIPREIKKREEKEKSVRAIEKNQRVATAIHPVDFLRPDVNKILGELAPGTKQK
ncbi:MAG: hypothetical protein WCH39_25340, partial [Schlesneria sp.]